MRSLRAGAILTFVGKTKILKVTLLEYVPVLESVPDIRVVANVIGTSVAVLP
jgi:hypothetical protein